jgi:hypothetical protein
VTFLTVDVVALLPEPVRQISLRDSALAAEHLRTSGARPAFELGQAFQGRDGSCEPHVSLFMLRIAESAVAELAAAVRRAVAPLPAFAAEGEAWRPNPQGAPEMHYRHTPGWARLQQAVLGAAAPLRSGLRDRDPSGARLVDLVAQLQREDPGSPRLTQLIRYGYDEITDDVAHRFRPHVTVTWPSPPMPQPPSPALTPPAGWSCTISQVGLFAMGPHGTCLRPLDLVELISASRRNAISQAAP